MEQGNQENLTIRKEGLAQFYIHDEDKGSIPSKMMNVFYNKKMELNRDITSIAINAYNNVYRPDGIIFVDSMAASGVGSIRVALECENIKKMYINDINPSAIRLIHKNLELNNLTKEDISFHVTRNDANFFFNKLSQETLLSNSEVVRRPNIISIDPFGTPNLYVNSAFNAIDRYNGLLCITATDTAVLFGVRQKVCIRKYMAKPLHNEFTKEVGARILVYFLSRLANINKLGIEPLLTFYSNHFVRVFARIIRHQKKISSHFADYGYILFCRQCGYRNCYGPNITQIPNTCPQCGDKKLLDYAGPLWTTDLHNREFLNEILKINENSEYKNKNKLEKMLLYVRDEIGMPMGYYNIHKLAKKLSLAQVPTTDDLLDAIHNEGFRASRTHFDFTSLKTDMDIEKLKEVMMKIVPRP